VSSKNLDAATSCARDSQRDRRGHHGVAPVFRRGLAAVRRNSSLTAGILALAVAAAFTVTVLQTPRYTASSTVEINEQTSPVRGDDPAGPMAAQTQDTELFLNTQMQVLGSRTLAERVVERLDLSSNQHFLEAMGVPDLVERAERERHAAVLRMVREHFRAELPARSRVAELNFTSTDPKMSAAVVNAFATEFIQADLQRKFDSSAYARSFVAEQLDEARSRLASSERDLAGYARAGVIRTRDPSNPDAAVASSMAAASLMQLSEATSAARASRVEAEARWNAESAQPLFSSPGALSSPTVQALMIRQAELESGVEAAKRRYLEAHPMVERLRAELQSVQGSLAQAANEARTSVRAEYEAAIAAEEQLQSRAAALQGATLAEQDRAARYHTLAREADANLSLYDGLLARYRTLNTEAGKTASNIAVIDRAEPPSAPSSPDMPRNVGLALLMGLALAGAIVFLRDQTDDRLRTPEDVESKLGLPLLGVLMQVEGEEPANLLDDPTSPLAESCDTLRSALLHSTREGLPHLLLVASAHASESKTTTSYAIARGFARVGKQVLLVDADMQRPAVHMVARLSSGAGLSAVLAGEATLADAILQTGQDGLSVLTSGRCPRHPPSCSPRQSWLRCSSRPKRFMIWWSSTARRFWTSRVRPNSPRWSTALRWWWMRTTREAAS
jgi:uncharacterized protein involved in exopolysaccharide biosynthesis